MRGVEICVSVNIDLTTALNQSVVTGFAVGSDNPDAAILTGHQTSSSLGSSNWVLHVSTTGVGRSGPVEHAPLSVDLTRAPNQIVVGVRVSRVANTKQIQVVITVEKHSVTHTLQRCDDRWKHTCLLCRKNCNRFVDKTVVSSKSQNLMYTKNQRALSRAL